MKKCFRQWPATGIANWSWEESPNSPQPKLVSNWGWEQGSG